MSKPSSFAVLTEALHDHGWEFEVKKAEVAVPDPENAVYNGYSTRASYMPTKAVPGRVVTAHNRDKEAPKRFTAQFTEGGSYLAQHTKGSYPFHKSIPLKKALAEVQNHGPQALAERRAERDARESQRQAEEVAEVAAAYAEAKEALVAAQHEAFNMLAEDAGLSTAQAEAVLVMAQTGKFAPLLNALASVERVGKGWLPGRSYVSGTYMDGVLVSAL